MKNKLFYHDDGQCYGTTTVGERGQVVVPNELRSDLKLKRGEKLLVFSRFGKIIVLVKPAEFENFLTTMIKNFGTSFIPRPFKKIVKAKNKRMAIKKVVNKYIKD